jgi:hypothetical protein
VDAVADFTGTAADDVFNATSTTATTVNSGDAIDGGAGNDTLNITATATTNNSLSGLTAKAVETVNIDGANNLGASTSALAAAQDARAVTAAELAAKNASLVLAAQQANAANAVEAVDENIEATVVGLSTATTTALAASRAAAAVAVFALADAAATAAAALTAVDDVADLDADDFEALGFEAFTLAQYKAAAAAALKEADSSDVVAAGIVARAGALADAAIAVDVAAKSTEVDLATALQQQAAADAVDGLDAEEVIALTELEEAPEDFESVTYTFDQYQAAANAALIASDGTEVDEADIEGRAADLAEAAAALVAFKANGDFTLAQLNSAAKAALSSNTGSTLVTNLDDGTAIAARAAAKADAADDVLSAATTAATTAAAADAAAANAVTVALAGVTATTVSAAQFADATAITLSGDSSKAKVTGVAATQTIGIEGVSSMENAVTFVSTVTKGLVAVDGSDGTLTVSGAKMTALKVSGTGSTDLTIVDGTALTTTDTIKTLNLDTSGSTVLKLTEANTSKLTTVTQEGAGGVTLKAFDKIASVTTGAGADTLYLETATLADTPTTSIDETINATLNSGAGDDRLVINTSGTGTLTVDAGEGNDTLYVNGFGSGANSISAGAGGDSVRVQAISSLQKTKVDGGAGSDTLRTTTTAFGATEYTTLTANVSNFEKLETTGVVTALDASKVDFTSFSLLNNATISKVSSTQTIVMARTAATAAVTGFTSIVAVSEVVPNALTVTAKGYLLDSDTVTGGNQTVFGDNLNVTMKNTAAIATGTIAASGSNLTLAIEALGDRHSTATTTGANVTGISSAATVSGDLKSIDATLTSARGSSLTTAENAAFGEEELAGLKIVLDSNNESDAGTQTLLNLESVKVSGAGTVTIDARTDIAAAAVKLKSIDLSGMTEFADKNNKGQEVAADGTVGGYNNKSTSSITLDVNVVETVLLGGARDTITTGSTIAATDIITGFQVTASAANPLLVDLTRSDELKIGVGFTVSNAAKMATTATSLQGALLEAANFSVAGTAKENVVFHFGGDTYAYVDSGADGLTDNDKLVKMSGTLNLDLLLQSGVIIA